MTHQKFLTWLSVRPGSRFAISDYRFPTSALALVMVLSSSADQAPLRMLGSVLTEATIHPQAFTETSSTSASVSGERVLLFLRVPNSASLRSSRQCERERRLSYLDVSCRCRERSYLTLETVCLAVEFSEKRVEPYSSFCLVVAAEGFS